MCVASTILKFPFGAFKTQIFHLLIKQSVKKVILAHFYDHFSVIGAETAQLAAIILGDNSVLHLIGTNLIILAPGIHQSNLFSNTLDIVHMHEVQ